MKSPFPGMDPYLEQHWRDVHASLVLYTRNQLQPQLGPSLRARVEERVVVDSPDEGSERGIYPDVRVVERGQPHRPISSKAVNAVVAEPLVIRRQEETHTEGYVQIVDTAEGNRVVTVIEILSDTNKRPGAAREEYRRKQKELADGGVNLVEIDLLRSGRRVFRLLDHEVPPASRTPYAACVYRADDPSAFEYYAFALCEPLPAIRIPLRVSDPDAALDIQALIDHAYVDGAYDDIDYSKPPVPALSAEDWEWAQGLLGAGR